MRGLSNLHPLRADAHSFEQGNQDGQPITDFGALSAYAVPFIVVPNRFGVKYKDVLPGNNVAAVIW